jgi:hypothetical protein
MPRFRVLEGKHICNDADGYEQTYVRSEVFEDKLNCLRFNAAVDDRKFELVGTNVPLTKKPPSNTRHGKPITTGKINPDEVDAEIAAMTGSRSPGKKQAAEKPASAEGDTYDSMTIDELKKFAESEEIPLGNAATKAQIIAAIRAAAPAE